MSGVFYRAVAAAFRDRALSGSREAGRYSRPDQPTLYLSASRDGVEAALRSHGGLDDSRDVVAVSVTASSVLDLRDGFSLRSAGLEVSDALSPWKDIVSAGGEPPSWAFRDSAEALGAHGLIDPSRQEPGLWHLVLFAWNRDNTATARLLDG
ncbi:RES family NAD+ phosphorylase [Nocardioidaceae bacterium]|nr:RES family NAD+ phosphorylase [Nocardioidaceae bacterium]